MTSNKHGIPQAHRTSESSQSTSQATRQSTDTHISPRSLFDHDSSNFLSPAFSATTTNSRPVSGISSLPSPTFRDSFISIVDDPFFQKLQEQEEDYDDDNDDDDDSPGPEREPEALLERPLPQLPDEDEDENQIKAGGLHGSSQASPHRAKRTSERLRDSRDGKASAKQLKWPPPRRESLTIGHFSALSGPSNRNLPFTLSAMETINIAIIGATGVGKSSFVQRVLGRAQPPDSNASTLRMVVENQTYGVTLLELDLEYFDMTPTQPIQWPKQVNGHIVPRVDGALILYDVTNHESIEELPNTLAALTRSNLPSILVACKCDTSENARQVDPDVLANHDYFRACVANYKISSNKPEHSRACLNTILRAAIANRREGSGEFSMARRRAASVAQLDTYTYTHTPTDANGRPLSQHSKHSRASSDLSMVRGFPNPPVSGEQYRGHPARSPRLEYALTSGSPVFGGEPVESGSTVSSQLRTPGIRLDRSGPDSFLDMEESDGESYRYSDDIPILQRNDEASSMENNKPSKATGATFDELVDRLVALRMTKSDHNFGDVFLCLYRKFAAPAELFAAILTRLDRVRDNKTMHYLTKTATQLRIIEMVAKWVSLYPGDFARPATRRNLEEFIRHLSSEPIFSISAHQIRRHLECNVVEDDDTGWAKSDELLDHVTSGLLEKDLAKSDMFSGISNLQLDDDKTAVEGSRTSASSEYLHPPLNQFQFHSYEEYEREAASMEPSDHLPMNKARYHIFMDLPDDDIADEMTRIDWVMFSSIRIRDFVRHVSLPTDQKERCRSLKNVNRMIGHFNHVAKWVANMILLRDKPKHRAQMMEKFMNIALKLRQLNNYNGLAAVLAGINGSSIHRLTQTRALVPADVQKNFARLVILMGTQKSHFAYRLAWENSPLPRIPFIPLHRRDLVSAEEGSKTFVGPAADRINWKKFEVLGEVLLPIMKSQGTPYPNLRKHEAARQLILDCRMPTDDEEIYERSIQVESNSGGPAEPPKKKFPWFAK